MTDTDVRKVIFGPGRVRVSGSRVRGITPTSPSPVSSPPVGGGHGQGIGRGAGGGRGHGKGGGGNSLAALAAALGAVGATAGVVIPSPDVGTTWYLQAGVPSNTLGAVGSWYVNSSNLDVYEKSNVAAVPTWQADTATDAGNGLLCNASVPSGVVAGELLVLQLDVGSSGGTPVVTTPTGWTVLTAQQDLGSAAFATFYWKVADGTETTVGLVADRNCVWHATISRVSNVLASGPINTATFATPAGGAGVTTSQSPSISPTATNCLIVAITAMNANAGMTLTAPAGMALRFSGARSGITGLYHGWADVIQAATGATGTKTWAMSSASFLKQLDTTVAIAPLAPSTGSWSRVGAFSA